MRKILVAIDGFDTALRALDFAVKQASLAPRAELHVLTVRPPASTYTAWEIYVTAERIEEVATTRHKGKFKIAFSISGIVIDQFKLYAPEVIESFKKLAQTGMVEFLAETEAHSLASLKNRDEFTRQVNNHRIMIK